MGEPVFNIHHNQASRDRAEKRRKIEGALFDAVFVSGGRGPSASVGPQAACLPYLRVARNLLTELIAEIEGGSNG